MEMMFRPFVKRGMMFSLLASSSPLLSSHHKGHCRHIVVRALSSRAPARQRDVSKQVESLIETYDCSSRKLLQPRHARDFDGRRNSDALFDRFARTICAAKAVPRKELFEAWVMALYVHQQFPNVHRIADLACGHGLVSWALLLLYNNTSSRRYHTSAVCIDTRMPSSADKVAEAMLREWPDLEDSWDYVEGSIDDIVPAPSTLLVAVHACGILSDKVISLALRGNAPVALVPCCHTKKSLSIDQRLQMKEDSLTLEDFDLSTYIDNRRFDRLQNSGMDVQEVFLPQIITPKNRVFLASPHQSMKNQVVEFQENKSENGIDRVGMKLPAAFSIPVADNDESRCKVRAMAGRLAATERKQPPPPTLCLSIFLPPGKTFLPLEQLTSVVQSTAAASLKDQSTCKIEVKNLDEDAFLHPSGMYARTFSVQYHGIAKDGAKRLHVEFRGRIPEAFPGAVVRG